jgi:hypothetical protein
MPVCLAKAGTAAASRGCARTAAAMVKTIAQRIRFPFNLATLICPLLGLMKYSLPTSTPPSSGPGASPTGRKRDFALNPNVKKLQYSKITKDILQAIIFID